MGTIRDRTRSMVLLAGGVVLLASGFAAGTVGGRLTLGALNDGGSASTTLQATSTGAAFAVVQTGSGAAITGSAVSGSGVGGEFKSAIGTGLLTTVTTGHWFGLSATNDATFTGAGGAVQAKGRLNDGVVAESWTESAVVATASGTKPTVDATSTYRTAIRATGPGGHPFDECDGTDCPGVESTGAIGVKAGTGTADGVGVLAIDQTPGQKGFAIVSAGDAVIDGALSVSAGCTGCGTVTVGRNGSADIMRQGSAVTLVGLEAADDGTTILVVEPAEVGDDVIGIVDRALTPSASVVTAEQVAVAWHLGGTEVVAGGELRLVLGGLLTIDGPLAGVAAGDGIWIGGPGELVPADPDEPTQTLGTYLGERPDGHGVLLLDLDR